MAAVEAGNVELLRGSQEKSDGQFTVREIHLGKSRSVSTDVRADDELETPLMSSATVDHLSFTRFVTQLLIQWLLPLSLPLAWALYGRRGAQNMGFYPHASSMLPLWFFFSVLWPAVVFSLMGVMLAHRAELESQGISVVELLGPVGAFTLHRMMVAAKYATLTEPEFQRFCMVDAATAMRYQVQLQLLTGWNSPPRAVMAFELRAAELYATQTGCEASRFVVDVAHDEPMARKWRQLLRLAPDEPVPTRVPVRDVARRIAERTLRAKLMWRLGMVLAVLHAALPLANRALIQRLPVFGTSALGHVATVLAFVVGLFWYQIVAQFILSGVLEYRRRALIVRDATNLIRFNDEQYDDFPQLDLTHAVNVRSWVALRLMFVRYGVRYRFRIQVYMGAALSLLLVFAVYLAYQFVSTPPLEFRRDTATQLVLFDTVVWVTLLWVMVLYGARTNTSSNQQRANLIRHQTHVASRSLHLGQDTVQDVMRTLDSAQEMIDALKDGQPETLMGIKADTALATSMITVFGAGMSVFLQAVFLDPEPSG